MGDHEYKIWKNTFDVSFNIDGMLFGFFKKQIFLIKTIKYPEIQKKYES